MSQDAVLEAAMVSGLEELDRREAATREQIEELRARIAELTGRLEDQEAVLFRLEITRETMAEILSGQSPTAAAGLNPYVACTAAIACSYVWVWVSMVSCTLSPLVISLPCTRFPLAFSYVALCARVAAQAGRRELGPVRPGLHRRRHGQQHALRGVGARNHPRGQLIVVDNVVRQGRVADADSTSPDVPGSRAAIEVIGSHPRLAGTALQTVGSKGHDGLALARVPG